MTFADLVDIYWQMLEGQCLAESLQLADKGV